jgi:hypothetical protein
MKPLNQNRMEIIKTTPNWLPIEKENFSDEQLIEMYHCVFTNKHSDGFMKAEIKDLLFQKDYWFMESKQLEWELKLKNKLIEFGITFKSE